LSRGARARAYETLRAWLDAHGDVAVAAAALHVHAQTVRYRLGRVREALGDDALDDPAARLELALALRVAGD
jgi:DNA-binding PucR family transcriptional regulator